MLLLQVDKEKLPANEDGQADNEDTTEVVDDIVDRLAIVEGPSVVDPTEEAETTNEDVHGESLAHEEDAKEGDSEHAEVVNEAKEDTEESAEQKVTY